MDNYKVGVVVFMDVEAVDSHDAGHVATMLVRRALNNDAQDDVLSAPWRDGLLSGRVVDVMEVGVAVGNGYLWTTPTSKAWQIRGLDGA